MEPAVQAIFTSKPDFPGTSIDVFACNSTLGNLLRFVRKVDKPFRILVETVGGTVFFVRRENSPTELLHDVRGFGHTFPEAYTTWEADVKGSESHQRVVRYAFGGLNCLVRFGADGYYKDLVSEGSEFGRAPEPAQTDSADSVDNMLASALGNSTVATYPSAHNKPLTIRQGGQRIPQAAIFDLKTRSSRKKDQDTLSEELPRLWLAQIPNFILAYHVSGVFKDIQTRNVRQEVQDWESENRTTLRRFAVLIQKIVAFARGRSDGRLELRCGEVDVLELREQREEMGHTLPAAVERRWVFGKSNASECHSEGSGGPDSRNTSDSEYEDASIDWDELYKKDFTACSAEDCGYCGHCTY
ncbi:MAG: hypothetical protein Q9217_005012 [Psora testacea]